MNRVITFASLIATVVFLTLTFVLGFVIYSSIDRVSPMFWFIATVFIGSFISLLICLGNINSTVKLAQHKIMKKHKNDINFTTCPDYWTKRLVSNDGKTYTMCYNQFMDQNGMAVFIDGTMSSNNDGFYFNNPNLTNPLDDATKAASNLNVYRNMADYSNIETFVATNMYGEYTDSSHPAYMANLHTHDLAIVADSNNPAIDGNNNVAQHTHIYYNQGRRSHSHSLGWNENDNDRTTMFEHIEGMSNFNYWINPVSSRYLGPNEYATEINLTKLNEANNSCELAKMFNWSENAKCFKV